MLNIGCGSTFHEDWVNVDIYSTSEHVIEMDIRKGIAFEDSSFDVVYSSHVLEHMSKNAAEELVKEMMRVLKPGGILRLVVPDLEAIITNYTKFKGQLENSQDSLTEANYDWTMIELYDQVLRTKPGGMMIPFLLNPELPNKDFIIQRFGWEAERILKPISDVLKQINNLKETKEDLLIFGAGSFGIKVDAIFRNNAISCSAFIDNDESKWGQKLNGKPICSLERINEKSLIIVCSSWWKEVSIQLTNKGMIEGEDFIIFDKTISLSPSEVNSNSSLKEDKLIKVYQYINKELGEEYEAIFKEAVFRNSGEIHKWMYDAFSLSRLMQKSGISVSKVCMANESNIPNFEEYNLDILDGKVRKPDSLFMEGYKCN
ncbi:methyltransferase domain-containing protein [Lysinibacillus sp. CNPSo 3705]|uniref:methyltransferase domain-containing protein n=1 Tax=Lysinibacillus sp. CNPSo 3705 TaxID=3028148 RepID=UPI0023646E9E|nr:methyltransferase domain-containing protein [Lysinibacillus sp. CNPSo 3705]MDD1503983.1 methyltransferase domain-containing protein [Lysinibacillus sp. CNPSo 3705]